MRNRSSEPVIYGGDLPGHLVGGGGQDIIYGGSGNDRIEAGSDNDILHGGGGDDRIYVANYSGNTEAAFGDAGNDVFVMTAGEDISITGGAGDDIYYFKDYSDVDILISPGDGKDIVYGNPAFMAGTVTFVGVSRADVAVTWNASPFDQPGHDEGYGYRGDIAIALKDGSASIVFKNVTGSLEYGGDGSVYHNDFSERLVLNDFFDQYMSVMFSDGALDFTDGAVNVDMSIGSVSRYLRNYASIDLL